jgi:glycosyltransferase involved in cell wall biosynthesis
MSGSDRKVLMFAYPFPPLAAPGSFRMLRFARYLPEFGWQPLVLTSDPNDFDSTSIDYGLVDYLPEGIVVCRRRNLRPFEGTIDLIKRGVSRLRANPAPCHSAAPPDTRAGKDRRQGSLTKLAAPMRYFAGLLSVPDRQIGWFLPALRGALSLVRQHNPEVIFSTGPPFSSHLIATTLKRLTGLPLVLDFRDPWARLNWQGVGSNSTHLKIQRRLEGWCVRRADRVILNTSKLYDEFMETYDESPPERFVTLSNGYDPELVQRVAELRSATTAVVSSGPLRLCHPGTVYGKRTLKPLIAAVAELSKLGRHVVLNQVGAVDDAEQAIRYAEQLGVRESVVLHGLVSHAEVLRHMAAADIFVLSQPGTSLQVPAKLFEMLPFGRPVLALAEPGGATAKIVDDYELGVVVPAGHDNAIAQAVLTLADRQTDFALREGWHRAMSAFDGRAIVSQLGALLGSCLTPNPIRRRRPKHILLDAPSAEPSVPVP